jgi:hypothetical protein
MKPIWIHHSAAPGLGCLCPFLGNHAIAQYSTVEADIAQAYLWVRSPLPLPLC